MNIFTQFFSKMQRQNQSLHETIKNDLLRREATVGRHVFGPIPKGNSREFFRLDTQTWIWQESWVGPKGRETRQTKYVVKDRDIIKSVNGGTYEKINDEELKNFQAAVHEYAKRVKKDVYQV